MNTIKLSREIIEAYKDIKVDISYALSELLGYTSYECCAKLAAAPVAQKDTVDYPLDSGAYDALRNNFDGVDSYGEVAEILLWSNYWMGGRL